MRRSLAACCALIPRVLPVAKNCIQSLMTKAPDHELDSVTYRVTNVKCPHVVMWTCGNIVTWERGNGLMPSCSTADSWACGRMGMSSIP